jgi:hypothetical protein
MNFYRVETKDGSDAVGYWQADSAEAALDAMTRDVTRYETLALWAEHDPEQCGDVDMWHAEEAVEACAMTDCRMALFFHSYHWNSAPLVGNERVYFPVRYQGWHFVFLDEHRRPWSDGYIDVPHYATPADMLVAALEVDNG